MSTEHPSAAELQAFVRGDLPREQAGYVVRHLLAGCAACRSLVGPYVTSLFGGGGPARALRASLPNPARPSLASVVGTPESESAAATVATFPVRRPVESASPPGARSVPGSLLRHRPRRAAGDPAGTTAAADGTADADAWDDSNPTAVASAYDRAIERAFAAVLRQGETISRSDARAKELVARLTPEEVLALIAPPRELRCFAGFEALRLRSWALRRDDPRQMVKLAELAAMVAIGLGAEGFSPGQVEDFQSRSAAELSNAYRVVDRLQMAETTLEVARHHFMAGSQDRLIEARLLEVEANIRGDAENFAAALTLLDAALRIYRRNGDAHLLGRCLVKKGLYAAQAGRLTEAIDLLSAGLENIDAALDPETALAALHNTAYCLMASDRCREARSLLWRHQSLYQQHAGRQDRIKLRWLQGQIYAAMGDLEHAVRAFEETRVGLLEAGRGHHAATAILELAGVRLRQGDDSEARSLAREAAELFLGLETTAEEAAAMRQLHSALVEGAGAAVVPAAVGDLVEEVFKLLRTSMAAGGAQANRSA